MEPVKCKACGAPLPAGFGWEGFTCVYCGAEDCVDEPLRKRLLEYHELLRRIGPVLKEISPALRDTVKKLIGAGWFAHGWLLIVGGSFFLIGMFAIVPTVSRAAASGRNIPAPEIAGLMVPMYFVAFCLFYWLYLMWRKRQLVLVYGARPPVVPSGPAGCRLCGAPLPESGIVRRCAYCGTDSIVDERIWKKYRDAMPDAMRVPIADLEKILLRNTIAMERAFAYGSFYLLLVLPIFVFGSATMMLLLGNRHITQQAGSPISTGQTVTLLLIYAGLAVGFWAVSLPTSRKSIGQYRVGIKKELDRLRNEIGV